jgi:hypothetical protein
MRQIVGVRTTLATVFHVVFGRNAAISFTRNAASGTVGFMTDTRKIAERLDAHGLRRAHPDDATAASVKAAEKLGSCAGRCN